MRDMDEEHVRISFVLAYVEANPPPGSAAEDVAGAMGSTDNPTVMTDLERRLNISYHKNFFCLFRFSCQGKKDGADRLTF